MVLSGLLLACGSGAAVVPNDAAVDAPADALRGVGDASDAADLPADAASDSPRAGAPYPVVFVHGMAGFDTVRPVGVALAYWGNVVADLKARGEVAELVTLPPFDTSEARAEALETQLEAIRTRTGASKLNLIAHSQGGLDSRLLASPHGRKWGDRLATIVTVSTPHRGTKAANAATGMGDALPNSVTDALLNGLAQALQRTVYEVKADPHLQSQIRGLTESYLNDTFNPTFDNDPRVRYLSWAGRSSLKPGLSVCEGATYANEPLKLDLLTPILSPFVTATEWGIPPSTSDGLVTVESAKWGTFQGCIPADHLDEVDLPNAAGVDLSIFNAKAFYRDVVAEIRAHGH